MDRPARCEGRLFAGLELIAHGLETVGESPRRKAAIVGQLVVQCLVLRIDDAARDLFARRWHAARVTHQLREAEIHHLATGITYGHGFGAAQ